MAAIAGSKGRIDEIGCTGAPWQAKLASALLNREVSVLDALRYFRDNARLREVSVEVNMLCNLHCGYCYLAKRDTKNTVPLHVWKTRLAEAAMGGVSLIAVVGKEPFIDSRGPELLQFLSRVRRANKLAFRCGSVTNGTLLDRHIPALANIDRIDYLDISLDGIGPRHDDVRGPGSYARAMKGFKAAATLNNVGSLFINGTIHKGNAAFLRDFVFTLAELGVENLHFSPVLNFTADPALDPLLLSSEQTRRVIEELITLSGRIPGQTIFELPIEYVWRFLADGVISAEEMKEDANGVLFVRPDRDGRFYFKTSVFPGYFWSSARITHEGLYLSELDTVAWALPEFAIGDIRKEAILDLFAGARRKDGWFERYFSFTLARLLRLAGRCDIAADDFPPPDAWRRGLPSPTFATLQHA